MNKIIIILFLSLTLLSCVYKKDHINQNYNDEFFNKLFIISKQSIIDQLNTYKINKLTDINYSAKKQGIAVRLIINKFDHGCYGFIAGVNDFEEAAKKASINAGFFDNRYPKLTSNDLNKVEIEITIIGDFKKMKNVYDFELGNQSILIDDYLHRAFMQGQIALEQKWNKIQFIQAICRKAGMDNFAVDNKRIRLYKAYSIYKIKKFSEINIDK